MAEHLPTIVDMAAASRDAAEMQAFLAVVDALKQVTPEGRKRILMDAVAFFDVPMPRG